MQILFLKDMLVGFRTKAEGMILGTLVNKATLQSGYRINSMGRVISHMHWGFPVKSNEYLMS